MKLNFLPTRSIFSLYVCLHAFAISYCLAQNPIYERKFEPDFKQRYSGNKFDYEGKEVVGYSKPGSGNFEEYDGKDTKVHEQNNKSIFYANIGILKYAFYAILVAAVLFLAYTLINQDGIGLFTRGKTKHISTNDNDINANTIEHTDINALINHAEKEKNFRLAIRYHYLLVLKTLSLKNHIIYQDDKTNADYLNEINGKPFGDTFLYASYLYNYIWYGKFNIEAPQYARAKANFTALLKQVN